MAKAYIANRPVRFDRNYKVGEVIPEGVISLNMGRKLTEMGRILCVDLPDGNASVESPQDGGEPPADSNDSNDGVGGEFVCEVCGRAFQSQQGLAAHSRSHRE